MLDRLIHWVQGDMRGYMRYGEVENVLKDFNAKAIDVMKEKKADHVIYATKIYDGESSLSEVHFYMLPLDDDEFYKRTSGFNGIVCAVHALK